MLIISYNLSPTLKDRLAKIESLRKKVLTTPVSPQTELILKWQALTGHLEGWTQLANQPLTKTHIYNIVTRLHTKTVTPLTTKVLNYKKALDHIRWNWPANNRQVTVNEIKTLADILSVTAGSEKEIDSLLQYLQAGQVSPPIQAATTHLYFYPKRLSYLAAQLFLAKYGYDLHGWLSLEDYWSRKKDLYLETIQTATTSANTTLWLEFFCQGVIEQMEKIASQIFRPVQTSHNLPASFWKLSDRQKEILHMLDEPGVSIANKVVQSAFKISQITASRDLAKLTTLGLIVPHGSGRSTRYTRI